MANTIESIELKYLVAHPDNPNAMSEVNFSKLLRNISQNGRYEPLIVRPAPDKKGCFEIINGHHRRRALEEIGYKEADVIVWDVDDEQADILLATLNRLGGTDEVDKKIALLKRLRERVESGALSKLLPGGKKQLEHLTNMKRPIAAAKAVGGCFAEPLVFFVTERQKQIVESALSLVEGPKDSRAAVKRAAGLVHMAEYFLNHSDSGAERNGKE